MIGHFVEECRRDLKVKANKNKVMLGGKKGSICKVIVVGRERKHSGFVLDESGTDGVECFKSVACERRVAVRSIFSQIQGVWNLNI